MGGTTGNRAKPADRTGGPDRGPAGRFAPSMKYDILTALLVTAAQDAGSGGRLAGRLALLMTARVNWQSAGFAVGIREIARLWGVTERTAKREMAAMRARGWIAVRRHALRGRVAEHGVLLEAVIDATRAHWAAVGPDFVARMAAGPQEAAGGTVTPFPGRTVPRPGTLPDADGSVWGAASRLLWETDPAAHGAWFAKLAEIGVETGRTGRRIELGAPSRFAASYVETHFKGRLLAALSHVDPTITEVRLTDLAGV